MHLKNMDRGLINGGTDEIIGVYSYSTCDAHSVL